MGIVAELAVKGGTFTDGSVDEDGLVGSLLGIGITFDTPTQCSRCIRVAAKNSLAADDDKNLLTGVGGSST